VDNLIQQIELELGKDHLPNLHWQPEIPTASSVPPRANMQLCNASAHNTTVVLDNIEYRLNNLGYRSNRDYHVDQLQLESLVLVLGDSDAFGRGVAFDDLYSTKMQHGVAHSVINLGVPGISTDGMTRIAVKTILALGPAVKHVCVLWPVQSLREFVSKQFCSGVHNLGNTVPYVDWWDHVDWVSNNYNYQKNLLLLSQTTENAGAEFHQLMINRYNKRSAVTYNSIENNQFTEFTAESHTAIANYFVRKINTVS
jgi:hypothetical protein